MEKLNYIMLTKQSKYLLMDQCYDYCKQGNLDKLQNVIKYYFSIISYNLPYLFELSCIHGHKNTAQYIWDFHFIKHNKYIDLDFIKYKWVLCDLLQRHNSHILDYLYELSISINKPINFEDLFYRICIDINKDNELNQLVLSQEFISTIWNLLLKYKSDTIVDNIYIKSCQKYNMGAIEFLRRIYPYYNCNIVSINERMQIIPKIDLFCEAEEKIPELLDRAANICLQPTPITPNILHLLVISEAGH